MKLCEKTTPCETLPPRCPLLKPALPTPITITLKPAPKDRLLFGMGIELGKACCTGKLKTGRKGGCCSHVPHEQFIQKYHAILQRETETTGIRPKLDPEIEAVLAKHPLPPVDAKPKPASAKPKLKLPPEPLWQRVLKAPFRFLKWLFVGFWKDMKLLFTGKEEKEQKKP